MSETFERVNKSYEMQIYQILNMYETLAKGILTKYVDENIVKSLYRPQIINAYVKFKDYILKLSNQPNNPPSVYSHFKELYEKWK